MGYTIPQIIPHSIPLALDLSCEQFFGDGNSNKIWHRIVHRLVSQFRPVFFVALIKFNVATSPTYILSMPAPAYILPNPFMHIFCPALLKFRHPGLLFCSFLLTYQIFLIIFCPFLAYILPIPAYILPSPLLHIFCPALLKFCPFRSVFCPFLFKYKTAHSLLIFCLILQLTPASHLADSAALWPACWP